MATPSLSGPQAGASSLKSSQLAAVTHMLSSPSDSDAASPSSSSSPWKILIYDSHCRSIISPLLSVSQLRSPGVPLHLLPHSEREPIPDVPAVYFVQPTQENLTVIARDCQKQLYQCAHLHFATRLERPLMEQFARLVVNTVGFDTIASVHDQFVDSVCHAQGLFSLNVGQSYVVYNDPGAGEREMEGAMDRIAGGLFSVVATTGAVPVIRCPRVS